MSLETQARQLKQDFDDVYEAGKQAEYDAFWDEFQANGARKDYQNAFSYAEGWNNAIFKPKYQIKPTNAQQMFYRNTRLRGEIEGILNIDFSNCTNFRQAFQNVSFVTHLGVIDLRKATDITNAIVYCSNLATIDKIIVDESLPASLVFASNESLENVTIEGELVKSVNAGVCPFTIISIKSIISALKDYSTESPFTYTLTLKDSCKTELEADTEMVEFNGQDYTYFNLISAKGWNLA